MLTAEQMRVREGRLTASAVACLMTGEAEKILALWRLLIGDPQASPQDLSEVWPARLGEVTEPLNLEWYQRKTGRTLSRQGEVVISATADWAACTLDAWDDILVCPVEAKHVGGREPRDKILARYQPQLHWQMLVTGARRAMLTLIEGAGEPALEEVVFDEAYARELWQRAEAFMVCVVSLRPPVSLPPGRAPISKEQMRRFDLDRLIARGESLPNWAHALLPELSAWRETVIQARANARALKAIKALLPEDVGFLRHVGVAVTRAKNGAVSVRAKGEEEGP